MSDENDRSNLIMEEQTVANIRGEAILCRCARFRKHQWCPHTRRAILDGWDVEDGVTLQHSTIVPLFFDSDHYVPVMIKPPENNLRAVHLVCGFLDPVSTKDLGLVGFIAPHQGRRAVRPMILEWFAAKHLEWSEGGYPSCQSQAHAEGHSPCERWVTHPDFFLTEDGLPKRSLIIDIWSLLATGNCRTCVTNDGIPDI